MQDAAIKRAPEQSQTSTETADLLEALRRRRGQRMPLPSGADEGFTEDDGPQPVALFDALEPGYAGAEQTAGGSLDPNEQSPAPQNADGRRKGRPAMPSWDEIVFGARSEDS